jgi:hypothetical protein
LVSLLVGEDGPLCAKLILETPRLNKIRPKLNKTESTWINKDGEEENCTLILNYFEKTVSKSSYVDTMGMVFQYNFNEYISPFIGKLLLKRANDDPEFKKAMEEDNIYLPILFYTNEDAKNQMSDYKRELTPEAKDYMKWDMITHAGFKNPNSLTPLDQDIVAMQSLLADKQLMIKQLKKLNAELNIAIRKSNPDAEPLEPLMSNDPRLFKKPYTGKSFFFEFFKDWATQNGFNDLVRFNKALSNIEFTGHLKKGNIFKDNAFEGMFHGAWTHLIQWYCIAAAAQAGDIKLNFPAAHIFQMIAITADNYNDNDLWGFTFETSHGKIRAKNDFRQVEEFNAFLTSDEMAIQCPAVQAMLKYRNLRGSIKISNQDSNNPSEVTNSSSNQPNSLFSDLFRKVDEIISYGNKMYASNQREQGEKIISFGLDLERLVKKIDLSNEKTITKDEILQHFTSGKESFKQDNHLCALIQSTYDLLDNMNLTNQLRK